MKTEIIVQGELEGSLDIGMLILQADSISMIVADIDAIWIRGCVLAAARNIVARLLLDRARNGAILRFALDASCRCTRLRTGARALRVPLRPLGRDLNGTT